MLNKKIHSNTSIFQSTSVSVKKRFPTADHLIDAGLWTKVRIRDLLINLRWCF